MDVNAGAYTALLQQADELRAEVERLREWQVTVTAALRKPGGSFFDDVPAEVRKLPWLRDKIQIGRAEDQRLLAAAPKHCTCYYCSYICHRLEVWDQLAELL